MSVKFISKINRRLAISLIVALPVTSAGVGVYFYLKNRKVTKEFSHGDSLKISSNDEDDESSIYGGIKVFPELKVKDFYGFIKMKKNNAVIDDDFIAAVINFVIKNAKIIGGELLYNYHQLNDQQLQVVFKWESDENIVIEKTYIFSLIT